MKSTADALYLLHQVGGFGNPDEGFGIVIEMVDAVGDRSDQICNAAKDFAAKADGCQVAEEALHHVQS